MYLCYKMGKKHASHGETRTLTGGGCGNHRVSVACEQYLKGAGFGVNLAWMKLTEDENSLQKCP